MAHHTTEELLIHSSEPHGTNSTPRSTDILTTLLNRLCPPGQRHSVKGAADALPRLGVEPKVAQGRVRIAAIRRRYDCRQCSGGGTVEGVDLGDSVALQDNVAVRGEALAGACCGDAGAVWEVEGCRQQQQQQQSG